MWTFGKKIAAGFAISTVLLIGIGTVAYRGFESLLDTSRLVTHTHQVLNEVATVFGLVKDLETSTRGFVIAGDDAFLEPFQEAIAALPKEVKQLRDLTVDNPLQQKNTDQLESLVMTKVASMKRYIDVRKAAGLEEAAKLVAAGDGRRTMDAIRAIVEQMESEEARLLAQRADEAEGAANGARSTIVFGTVFCILFVTAAGFWLTRSLTTQIGMAVQHVQRSSTELQSVANQQASGAKESSTSMNEISTTISELLATARQIAESAQRVAGVAERTAGAARAGEDTVQKASDSIVGIRRQVDMVVNHMLELGTKSQQIGGVVEIVSELAEQTNILAINATIEAAGAGETGKRFAVVADEIRKLADRVASSTKEIRGLIDDVRSAVNTTVMATETGSKAVDAGNRQFGDVASSFKQIAELVSTTTEAAREIELSTKQQTTAVEQVNVAIANTAQATRETESSTGQTLQTATQLAGLSRELLRLVQAQAA